MTLFEKYAKKAEEIWVPIGSVFLKDHWAMQKVIIDLLREAEQRVSAKLRREGAEGVLVEMQITNVFREMRGEER